MHLDAVGNYLVGARRHLLAVAHVAHQPAVVHLEHVDVDFVVGHLLQVLYAADHSIEYPQAAVDITLK